MVSYGWFLTNTLLLDCICCWTEINSKKLLLSLQSSLVLLHCNSLMGKRNLNLPCSPGSQRPEVAEGVEPPPLPWSWESSRDPKGTEIRSWAYMPRAGTNLWGDQKPEATSSPISPPPTYHQLQNFPWRSQKCFLGWQPKACACCWRRLCWFGNPAVPKRSLLHKRAACFLMLKHFLQPYR